MAFPSWVDASLDLNLNPLRLSIEAPKKEEVQMNFMELGVKTSVKNDETSSLVEELNRISEENKKLTHMLTVMCENYNALRTQLTHYTSMNNSENKEQSPSKKRKLSESSNNLGNDNIIGTSGNSESSSSDEDDERKKVKEETMKAKISRISVRVDSSDKSLVVKDGYQWRKYGQKVTRDNPCPRAYFKCSFAPSCPVKKKVQRSVEDQSMLVATYEGEHNHPVPSQTEVNSSSSRAVALASIPPSTTPGPTLSLDLPKSKISTQQENSSRPQVQSQEFRKFLVEQMASSLSKDPNFTAALVAAISGRNHNQNSSQNW